MIKFKNIDSQINIRLVGALTSKPYAYTARPWELETVDSIDFHDALGSSIQISIRGSEILRVLPKVNENLNEEWITDKARFSYDGTKQQRLTEPLIKEEGKFKKITWEKAFNILKDKYNKNYTFSGILGNITDAETALLFKDFISKLGNGVLISKNSFTNIKNDLRTDYLLNISPNNLSQVDACLVIGSNLRLEAPLLNLKFRKNVLYNNLKVYTLGYTGDLTYPVTHIGNNTKYLLNIIEGKHPICKILSSAIKPQIFVGSSLPEITSNLFGNVPYNININYINQFSTNIIDLEFNIQHRNTVNRTKKQVLYILNHDDIIITKQKSDFIVYQGHHGSPLSAEADLILPGSTLFEKNGTLINIQGLQQNINFCVKPPALARNDWKIFEALINFFGLKSNYLKLQNIKNALYVVAPPRQLDYILKITEKNLCYLQNKYFNTSINNYYSTDILTRNSNTLALASARFNLHNYNFLKL